jgi:hypothetical protein
MTIVTIAIIHNTAPSLGILRGRGSFPTQVGRRSRLVGRGETCMCCSHRRPMFRLGSKNCLRLRSGPICLRSSCRPPADLPRPEDSNGCAGIDWHLGRHRTRRQRHDRSFDRRSGTKSRPGHRWTHHTSDRIEGSMQQWNDRSKRHRSTEQMRLYPVESADRTQLGSPSGNDRRSPQRPGSTLRL